MQPKITVGADLGVRPQNRKITAGADAVREVEQSSMRMGPAAPGIWCAVRVGVATQPAGSAGGRAGFSPAP